MRKIYAVVRDSFFDSCGGCMESNFNDISGCHRKYTGVYMRSKRFSKLGCLTVFMLILLIWGCASDPVDITHDIALSKLAQHSDIGDALDATPFEHEIAEMIVADHWSPS